MFKFQINKKKKKTEYCVLRIAHEPLTFEKWRVCQGGKFKRGSEPGYYINLLLFFKVNILWNLIFNNMTPN